MSAHVPTHASRPAQQTRPTHPNPQHRTATTAHAQPIQPQRRQPANPGKKLTPPAAFILPCKPHAANRRAASTSPDKPQNHAHTRTRPPAHAVKPPNIPPQNHKRGKGKGETIEGVRIKENRKKLFISVYIECKCINV